MSDHSDQPFDVVGVGFGPSNLSLAIALEEHPVNDSDESLRALFVERQECLGWHRSMLLPSTTMQISFLKDLVTFRNPTSRFSFLSYLHDSGRLPRFANTQDFFPTRREFHDYLEWAAARIRTPVTYGAEASAVRPVATGVGGPVDTLEVDLDHGDGDQRTVQARNLVVSTGLRPRMPEGVERGARVWHSSEFLERFQASDATAFRRVVVVGAGQSAAEIVRFLHDALPQAVVSAVMSSYGYSIADDTPFANQIFDPAAVDDFFYGTDRSRSAFWRYHSNTNYAVVDADVIRDLYRRSYDEEVAGESRLEFLNLSRVEDVRGDDHGVRVGLHSLMGATTRDMDVDLLVCATGYEPMDPTALLGDLDVFCHRDEQGRYQVERDYRIVTDPALQVGIYLQGGTEATHGLTSSLLSNIAIRSGEIADAVVDRRFVHRLRSPHHAPTASLAAS